MRLVLCNCPKDASETLARHLVEQRLAACVNIVPGVQSVYRWEGKLCVESESTLLIKTRAELVDKLTQELVNIHPYDVPEVIAVPILEGHGPYLQWLVDETTAKTEDAPQ